MLRLRLGRQVGLATGRVVGEVEWERRGRVCLWKERLRRLVVEAFERVVLLDALLGEDLIDAVWRASDRVLVELVGRLRDVLGISDDLLGRFGASDEARGFFVGALCLGSPISVEIGVLLLDDVGLLLGQEHPASLLFHVVKPSMLMLQSSLRLALHRRHLHTHQILLLRQALPEAVVKVMLACAVAGRRRRQ